ncbi:hypothetical protein ACLB2K_051490 [Fragaria x ananassa]
MDLKPSPFSYLYDFANYTFFNCSPNAKKLDWYPTLSCLSSDNYKVIAVPTNPLLRADPVTTPPATLSSSQVPSPFDPNCSVISTARVPIEPKNYDPERPNPSEWENINFGVQLKWDEPDCRHCDESSSIARGIVQTGKTGPEVRCSNQSNGMHFKSCRDCHSERGGSVSGTVVDLAWFALRLIGSDSIEQLPVSIMCGLDQATIESYPKTQLGESREWPSSGDNTCPICLEEYQAKETIRTIPECNHYFHANCVDKWLKKNPTCPLCRNPPEGERDKID